MQLFPWNTWLKLSCCSAQHSEFVLSRSHLTDSLCFRSLSKRHAIMVPKCCWTVGAEWVSDISAFKVRLLIANVTLFLKRSTALFDSTNDRAFLCPNSGKTPQKKIHINFSRKLVISHSVGDFIYFHNSIVILS